MQECLLHLSDKLLYKKEVNKIEGGKMGKENKRKPWSKSSKVLAKNQKFYANVFTEGHNSNYLLSLFSIFVTSAKKPN